MTVNRMAGVVMAVVMLAAAVACSSTSGDAPGGSPKERLIASVDDRCRTISERFAGDLAYGRFIDIASVPKIRERVALLEDLRDHARTMPAPETGQADLDDWLAKLDTYVTELDNLGSQLENLRPGMDALLFLQAGVVNEAAKAIGPAGKRFGFDDCAQTENWEHLDP